MKPNSLCAASAFSALLMTGTMAIAGEVPSAAELSAAVSDHTYQGSMNAAGSGFAEYYAPNGHLEKPRTADPDLIHLHHGDEGGCDGGTAGFFRS